MKPPKEIRRNAEGVCEPTKDQITAAHAYATKLLQGRPVLEALPPLFLACALWNSHLHIRKLQAELAAITAVIARAHAAGLLQFIEEDADNDNDNAAPDPRMN